MGVETAVILAAASTAVSAYGSYAQSQAAKGEASYREQVANNNAIIAAQNEERIGQVGAVEQLEHRRRIAQAKGQKYAMSAAQGLDVSSGSALQGIVDIDTEGQYDILKIRDATMMEQRGARIQGSNYQAEAGLQRLRGNNISPLFNAGSTLLQGGSQTAYYSAMLR